MNEFEGFVSNFKTPYTKTNKKEEDQPKFESNFIAIAIISIIGDATINPIIASNLSHINLNPANKTNDILLIIFFVSMQIASFTLSARLRSSPIFRHCCRVSLSCAPAASTVATSAKMNTIRLFM